MLLHTLWFRNLSTDLLTCWSSDLWHGGVADSWLRFVFLFRFIPTVKYTCENRLYIISLSGPPLDYSFRNISSLSHLPSRHPRWKIKNKTIFDLVMYNIHCIFSILRSVDLSKVFAFQAKPSKAEAVTVRKVSKIQHSARHWTLKRHGWFLVVSKKKKQKDSCKYKYRCIPNQVQQQRNPPGKQQPGGHARIVPGENENLAYLFLYKWTHVNIAFERNWKCTGKPCIFEYKF